MIDFPSDKRQQERHGVAAVRYGMDPMVQSIHHIQHVPLLRGLQLNGSRRGGHQQSSRNSLAGNISNHYLDRVLIDRDVVVIIAAHASGGLHHACDLKAWDGGPVIGLEHPLNLRGQSNVMEKLIALFAYCPVEQFSLPHVSLDYEDDKGKTDKGKTDSRRQIVRNTGPPLERGGPKRSSRNTPTTISP
jgi:hypothetical protein